MKKINWLIVLFLLFFISFWYSYSFDTISSRVYLENISNNKTYVFYSSNFDKKSLLDTWIIEEINSKIIWDTIINWKWKIIKVCIEEKCYREWEILSSSFIIKVKNYYQKDFIIEHYDDKWIYEFDFSNISFKDKLSILSFKDFWYIFLEFLFFLPLNLLIFQCLWYLLYIIFFKKYKINYFKRIYLNAWIFYILSLIILYSTWNWFLNWNSAMLWFMWYFMLIGVFKLILFLVSRYTIEKYKRDEKIKSNFETYILLFYIFLFLLLFLFIHFFR